MAGVARILPVLVLFVCPSSVLTKEIFTVESSSKEFIYDETKVQSFNITYKIHPWPPDWRPSSTDEFEVYRDVRVQLYNNTDTASALLCQAKYLKGDYVNETLTDSCALRSSGRVNDFRPGYNQRLVFTLNGVTLWDMKNYILVVKDTFDVTYQGTVSLTVKARPLPIVSLSNHGNLEEGENVTFTCMTQNAWPVPDLQWTRGPLRPIPSDKIIARNWWELSSAKFWWLARKEDHGVSFTCTAQNGVGQPRDDSIALSVLFVPQVTIRQCEANKPHAVREGLPETLSCDITSNPSYSLQQWRSPQGVVMATNETRLIFETVRREDAGSYTCTARNSKGTGSHDCHLDVQYGVTIQIPNNVTFKEFELANVSCNNDANPEPEHYQWTKQGDSTFQAESKTLEFISVRPENGGRYTCKARNYILGESWTDESPLDLLIEYKPRLANYSMTKFAGEQGQTAILDCQIWAYPAFSATWRFKGNDVTEGPRHQISSNQSASRLQISSVRQEDYGSYSCDVTNAEGAGRFQMTLLRPGKPDPPQTCTTQDIHDREVTLTCIPGYDGGDRLTFTVSRTPDGQRSEIAEVEVIWPEVYDLGKGQLVTLKVKGFGPNTNYTLVVYGDNRFGRSEDGFNVYLRTADGPPLPTAAPPNVGAIVGGVVGGLLVVIIVISAALYVRKYGTPEVPDIMRRQSTKTDRKSIMNRHSDDVGRMHPQANDVGRRYADRESWNKEFKDGDLRRPMAEPNRYVLHPGPASISGGYTGSSTEYRDDGDYRDYGHHGNYESEAAMDGHAQSEQDWQAQYGYANYGYANDEYGYENEAYANEYQHSGVEHGSDVDGSRFNLQVSAEVYRHEPEVTRQAAHDDRKRQSHLAGMGALAGSHVMLHQRLGDTRSREEDEARRMSQEPLTEGVSVMQNRWDYPRHQLSFREKLGEGLFGEVWRAYADNLGGRRGRQNVAVKLIKDSCPPEERSSLWRELEVLKMLLPHPNVTSLLGACSEREPLLVILEYCSKGNLLDFLRKNREIPRGLHPGVRGVTLTTRALTCFVNQIANGMDFISSKGLLHRDLAARNILLDDRLTCKISDFGFARDIAYTRQYEGKTRRRLPLRWMAPESLYDCLYSTQSDVWAFGVCIWEVMTLGSSPYPGMTGHDVMELVNTGFRMEKPLHCSSSMYAVMRDCWRPTAQQRPSWSALSMRVAAILEDLDDNPDDVIAVNDMEGSMFEILQDPPGEKC